MDVPRHARADELGAEVGIIGGSGFYELLDDSVDVDVNTPFGDPAAPDRKSTRLNSSHVRTTRMPSSAWKKKKKKIKYYS